MENKDTPILITESEVAEIISSIENAPVDGFGRISRNRNVHTVPFKKLVNSLNTRLYEFILTRRDVEALKDWHTEAGQCYGRDAIYHMSRYLHFPEPRWRTPTEENPIADPYNETLATEYYVSERVAEKEGRLSMLEERAQQILADIEGLRQDIINESHFRGYLLTDEEVRALAGNAWDYAYSAESGTKWIFHPVPEQWIDTGTPVPSSGVPAGDSTPLMDGEASAGQEGAYSRADHRHPSDTSKVNKTGDTMTGPLTVSNVDGSVSYQADRIHQSTGHSERSIFLPPIRENTPSEENPSVGYLDETLVAKSEIEPITDKLDIVEEIAKGAQIAESFTSYEEMVNMLRGELLGSSDGLTELKYKKGQSIYIETVDVPDLWISRIEEDNHNPYLYTTDEAIVEALATNGYIQVGHYRLAQLENGKVNFEELVKQSEVSSASVADTIVRRITNGNINVPATPLNEHSATSKVYVDNNFVGKVIPTGSLNMPYAQCINKDGTTEMIAVSKQATGGTIMRTDEYGCGTTNTPKERYHTANKGYVDDAIANAGGGSGGGTKFYKHSINGTFHIINTTATPITSNEELVSSMPNSMSIPIKDGFIAFYSEVCLSSSQVKVDRFNEDYSEFLECSIGNLPLGESFTDTVTEL